MAALIVGVSVAAALLVLVCCPGFANGAESKEKHPLYLLSVLPYPDPRFSVQPAIPHGPSTIQGVRLAIEHINNATGILDNYHIELIDGNGGCDLETLAIETLVRNVFHSGKHIVGIIGPGCSDSAVAVSDMCAREEISLVTIHFGSTPLLADRVRFSYAFSTSDTSFDVTSAAIDLVQYNEWKTVAVLYDVSILVYLDRFRLFERELNRLDDYEIVFSAAAFNPDTPLDQLRKSFARIIFAFVGYESVCELVCLARHKQLVYPSYQWVFVGNPIFCLEHCNAVKCSEDMSFTVLGRRYECTAAEQLAASEGMMTIVGNCFSGEACQPDFFVGVSNELTCYQSHIYDGVWSLALALNNSIGILQERNVSLYEYHYGRDTITQLIQEQLYELQFCGLTRHVRYNRTSGSRNFSVSLYQFVDSIGSTEIIGSHDCCRWNIHKNATFVSDYRFSSIHIHASEIATAVVLLFSVVTSVLVVLTHILTVVYCSYDSVKASSPRLNHFVYGGCYAIMLSVSVYTLLKSFQFEYILYSVLCNVTLWFLSVGSTLILGTVCAKTWRLYDIFVLSSRHLSLNTKFSDRHLTIFILVMLSVDVILCTIWSSVDALAREATQTLELGDGEPRIEVEYQCHSESNIAVVMIAILTLYKVILLACSTCLAFLTRRIHIKRFQTTDVTRLVYSTCLVCGVGLPIFFITDQTVNRNISFVLLSTMLNTLVMLCFTFLFVPPLWPLLRQRLKQKMFP